ncbi:MAG: site-2 protease family protein [Bdellovibrionia bacterium]
MDILELGAKVGIYFIPFLFALCFHEFAHGFVAKMRGDNTAEMMGRLSMNPVVHMDFLGTLVLPILAIVFNSPIFFGWAKPVPVNPRNLKNTRVDMFWIALAGPLSNVLLALVGTVGMYFVAHNLAGAASAKAIANLLNVFIATNLFLAIFNIIPLHPLDGGKVLARFLPASLNHKLEENEHMTSLILMALVLTGALKILSIPVFWAHGMLINWAVGL